MPRRRKLRVLVVEDNSDHLALLERQIHRSPVPWAEEIVVANSFGEALDLIGNEKFDAVILDLSLPDSSPLETVENGIAQLLSVPIIVLTSLADEELGRLAIQNGAQDYLEKTEITPTLLHRSIIYAIERFVARSELEAKNRELKIFAHTLAHEIKNPLQPVTMGLSLLREKLKEIPEKLQSLVELAGDSSEQIAAIIDQLLHYADSDNASKEEPVDLNEVLAEIIGARSLTQGKLFDAEITESLPKVISSRTSLRQVFENLFTNSIRYREPSRRLEIRIDAETNFSGGDKICTIRFTDNGIGIASEDLPKIFEPFYRGSTARDRDGSGLGLNFCRQTVHRYGGAITVESIPGEGTTFIITLPPADS